MNRVCPTCEADLLGEPAAELREWRDGWLELTETDPGLVPYDESMRPPFDDDEAVRRAWFCSEDCRDAYKDTHDTL